MKLYYAAAATLLLGTSALAWTGSADKSDVGPVAATNANIELSSDKAVVADAKPLLVADSDGTLKKQWTPVYAALDKDLEKLALIETGKVQTASADSFADTKIETAALDNGKVETAWVDTDADAKIETAAVDKVEHTGMGGPLEEVAPASAAVVQPSNADPELDARGIPVISEAAFVPPGFNGIGGAVGGPDQGGAESYPACTATVTDNCVQLYERGVRASLAGGDTGAVTKDSTTTAMGGPYEPVEADSTKLAMNGDGEIDVTKGEMAELETAGTAIASHTEYQGVGGPVEAQSGYPPCSPGPGDDRCIQLYEPGVTGAGN